MLYMALSGLFDASGAFVCACNVLSYVSCLTGL